jgi:uncharacterized protein
MTPMATIALMALGLPIGFLIGLIGIGGVLLAPALMHPLGREIHDAVSLSLASFVMAGVMAMANALRTDESLRTGDWYLLAALMPGALVGSLITPFISAAALSLVISVCVVMAGLSSLRGRKPGDTVHKGFQLAALVGIGIVAGALSVVSGTGGPMVLVPLLLAASMDVRRVLAVAQIAQLPIAATATLTNGLAGTLDLPAAAVLSIAVVIGMLVGLTVSRRMNADNLRWIVAWCLVLAGAGLLGMDLWRIIAVG